MSYDEIVKALKKKRGIARGVISNKITRSDTREWWRQEEDLCTSLLAILAVYKKEG